MLKSNIGELTALGTAICWSLSATFFELSGKKVGSLAVNYIRLITGFIFISIFTFLTRGYLLPVDANIKNWIFLSISGLIGFFIGDLFLFQSLRNRLKGLYAHNGNIATHYSIIGFHNFWRKVEPYKLIRHGLDLIRYSSSHIKQGR